MFSRILGRWPAFGPVMPSVRPCTHLVDNDPDSTMSEQANQELVRKVYDAFVTKDLASILDLQADDVHWSVAGSADQIPWAAPRPGREGVADFLKTLSQWLVAEQFEIRDYVASGDKVVALGYQRGYVRPNERAYDFDFVHVWTVRDGKISSFRVYYDTAYVASRLHD